MLHGFCRLLIWWFRSLLLAKLLVHRLHICMMFTHQELKYEISLSNNYTVFILFYFTIIFSYIFRIHKTSKIKNNSHIYFTYVPDSRDIHISYSRNIHNSQNIHISYSRNIHNSQNIHISYWRNIHNSQNIHISYT